MRSGWRRPGGGASNNEVAQDFQSATLIPTASEMLALGRVALGSYRETLASCHAVSPPRRRGQSPITHDRARLRSHPPHSTHTRRNTRAFPRLPSIFAHLSSDTHPFAPTRPPMGGPSADKPPTRASPLASSHMVRWVRYGLTHSGYEKS